MSLPQNFDRLRKLVPDPVVCPLTFSLIIHLFNIKHYSVTTVIKLVPKGFYPKMVTKQHSGYHMTSYVSDLAKLRFGEAT